MTLSWGAGMANRVGLARRVWNWLGQLSLIAWIVDLAKWLLLQWSTVLSAAVATGFTIWAWMEQYGYLPLALVALGSFAVTIWTFNGIVWMRRQARPSPARITFDYSHALLFEGVVPALDLENKANTFELRLLIRNAANGPVQFRSENWTLSIEDRITPPSTAIIGTLARGEQRTMFPAGGFREEAYNDFKDRTEGTLEFSILYGHPDDPLSRRMSKTLRIFLFKTKPQARTDKETASIQWRIVKETDEPISKP